MEPRYGVLFDLGFTVAWRYGKKPADLFTASYSLKRIS